MAITKLQSSRDFFRIWFFWRTQAVLSFLVIVGLVMFYAYTATPKYESRAKVLLLPSSNNDLIISGGQEDRQIVKNVSIEDLNTEMDLIQSDQVLQDTIKSFSGDDMGLKARERGLFEKFVIVVKKSINEVLKFLALKEGGGTEFDSEVSLLKRSLTTSAFESNIFEVVLTAENSKQSSVVLNKLLEQYVLHHNKVFSQGKGVQFYEDQANVYKEKLEMAEQDVRDFQKSLNIVDLDGQNAANITLFTELTKELQMLEIDYDEAKGRIEIFENALKDSSEMIVTKDMRNIPALVELETGIIPLLLKRSEMSKVFTETSREYQDVNSQIAMLKEDVRNESRKALETDKLELMSLAVKKESLQKKIDQLRKEAVSLKEKAETLREMQRRVEFNKKNYLLYASKTEDSRINMAKVDRNLSNVTIADMPTVPVSPVSPNKILLLVLSSFFGIIAALGVPFILESLDHKLKTTDDIEELLSLPVISSIQNIK